MTHQCEECRAAVSAEAAKNHCLAGKRFDMVNGELVGTETTERFYFCSEKCKDYWSTGIKRFYHAKAKDKVPEERGIS